MKPTPLDQIDVDLEHANSQEKEMSFLDHLEELRWHIIRVLLSIMLIGLVAFFMKSFVMETVILGPKNEDFVTYTQLCKFSHWVGLEDRACIKPPVFNVEFRKLTDPFFLHLKVSLFVGLILGFPYLLWELWRFISPGLYDEERKQARGVVLFGSILFLMGASFGYFVLCPFAINFFASYDLAEEIAKDFNIESYIQTVTSLVLAAGILFELPTVIYLLAKMGLIYPSTLRSYRKHAFVVVLVISAVITPADPFSQILVSIPVYILYEFSILLAERVEKQREQEALS